MKLSLIPTLTCSGLTGCHRCHQVPLVVPWTPYRVVLFLEAPCTQLKGPCTHKDGSWSHHLVEDVEDHIDGDEDPGDGIEALMDDGEPLDGLEKH